MDFVFKEDDVVRDSKTFQVKFQVWAADGLNVRFHRWNPETRLFLPSEMCSQKNLSEAVRICGYDVWRLGEKVWPRVEKVERNLFCPACHVLPVLFSGWYRKRRVFYVKCRKCGMSGGRRDSGSASIQHWTRKVKGLKS